MKKPNDVKRPNSGGGSLGQFLRSRGRFFHVSKTAAQCIARPKNRSHFFMSRRGEPGTTYRKAGA